MDSRILSLEWNEPHGYFLVATKIVLQTRSCGWKIYSSSLTPFSLTECRKKLRCESGSRIVNVDGIIFPLA